MNSKSTAALLAGLLVAGLASVSAGQAAFAHSFTDDESATFLVKVDAIKVHMTLVGRNLGDPEMALEHVEHAKMQLDEQTLAELAERNERLATDIPAAFDELAAIVENGEPRPAVAQQIRVISDLLGEAISARIDSEHLSDQTVRALVVAGLVDNALHSYEAAHGAASDHDDSMAMEDGAMSAGIVDSDSYIASKLFTFRAKTLFHMIADDVPQESQAAGAAAWTALVDMRDAISHKSSVDDVTILVHGSVHNNLGEAFSLEIEGHAESEDEHDEDSMEEDHTG